MFPVCTEARDRPTAINCICKCMYKALMNTILQSLAVSVRNDGMSQTTTGFRS